MSIKWSKTEIKNINRQTIDFERPVNREGCFGAKIKNINVSMKQMENDHSFLALIILIFVIRVKYSSLYSPSAVGVFFKIILSR